MTPADDRPTAERWLLLIHQLPARPAYLRVKVWRRLQALGAAAVKNAVYALPEGERAREDFGWLLREIASGGGEAFVCEARMVDGLADREVRAMFDRARDADYGELARQARDLAGALGGEPSAERRAEARAQLARLRARLAQVAAIDFFGAPGSQAAEGLLAALEDRLREDEPAPSAAPADDLGPLRRRTWVTRRGVHVDRIASAWLVRRFVDPEAAFKFVPAKGYAPEPGELRFDMFGGEFTHEGDRCTFEVLLARAGPDDPALRAIAELVHDLDLKDGRFGRPETAGLGALVEGLCAATGDDPERLARGAALLDDLHAYFRRRRP
jgi:hypothetical protein